MKDIKELKINVPWGHIAAKAWGSPANFPVLCVHGLLDNAGAFNRLITQLPEKYYYVAIDLPGHGLSSHMPHSVTLNYYDYILSIRLIVENFKWKHFHYIGHSLGAQFGMFYSVFYPNQIQRLVLIEGFPTIISNKQIVSTIRRIHDTTIKFQKENDRFYTRDEVLYGLKFKRGVCLNTDAAEALLERSVSEINGMFKYNRDARLKSSIVALLNFEQIASICSQMNVEKIIVFLTTGTIASLDEKIALAIKENFKNITNAEVKLVVGNHDIHNNHPDRLAIHISKLFNETKILSKL